jgi:hypothetical protein
VAERLELLDRLETIAKAIAECERPMMWPCWMTYILEVLEDEADRTEYINFLMRLRFAITARLDTGGW